MTIDRFRANSVDVVFPLPGPNVAVAVEALAGGSIPAVWVGENGPLADMLVGRVVFEEGFTVILNDDHLSVGRQRLLEEAYWAISAGELDIGIEPDA
jgi:hypothetical protein